MLQTLINLAVQFVSVHPYLTLASVFILFFVLLITAKGKAKNNENNITRWG